MAHAATVAGKIVPSIFKSLSLTGYFGEATAPGTMRVDDGGKWRMDGNLRNPDAKVEPIQPGRLDIVNESLTAYFSNEQKKNSMQPRLRNAIQLIAEADEQRHPATHVALCFAAIESLLCTSSQAITDRISRRAATLLAPESDRRAGAIKQIKKLYDERSKLVHGERIDLKQARSRTQSRLLAAGCLRAILEWRQCRRRLGLDEDDEQLFFDQLEDAETTGRRVVGVSEDSSNWLPD